MRYIDYTGTFFNDPQSAHHPYTIIKQKKRGGIRKHMHVSESNTCIEQWSILVCLSMLIMSLDQRLLVESQYLDAKKLLLLFIKMHMHWRSLFTKVGISRFGENEFCSNFQHL